MTSCYLCSDHMRKHLTSVSTIKREGSTASMSLTNFVDQLDAPGASLTSFPSLADFSAAVATDALKWTGAECSVSDCLYTYS